MSETAFRVCTVDEGVILVEADTVLFRNGGIRLLSNGVFKAQFKSFVYFTAPGSGIQVIEDPALCPPPTLEPVLGAVVTAFRPRWSALDWLMFGALVVNAGLMAYDQFVRPLG